jgi:hypothetical protein
LVPSWENFTSEMDAIMSEKKFLLSSLGSSNADPSAGVNGTRRHEEAMQTRLML